MYCSNCGSKLPDNAKFCSNCGEKIQRLRCKMGLLMNIFRVNKIVEENEKLKRQIEENEKKYNESGFHAYAKIEDAIEDIELAKAKKESQLLCLQADLDNIYQQQLKTEAQIKTNKKSLIRLQKFI